MSDLNRIWPLFASNLFEIFIDPNLYNKDKILNTVISNYEKQPGRNNWDSVSNLHHYYNDWNNNKLEPVDLKSLLPIYKGVFTNIVNSIGPSLEHTFSIENITVYNDKDQYMRLHDHCQGSFFTAVHYLMCDDNSAQLSIRNPNSLFIYPPPHATRTTDLLNKHVFNSGYYFNWLVKPKKDTMVVFPSYLKHEVLPVKNKPTKYRIAISVNVSINTLV